MAALTMTGAHVVVYINGKPFARVSGFQWSSQTNQRPVYGLDSHEPVEFIPTTSSCQGQLSVYRLVGDGGAEGIGITTKFADLSLQKYWSLMLIDRSSDLVLFQADACVLMSESWQVGVKAAVNGSLSFQAFRWNNEVRSVST